MIYDSRCCEKPGPCAEEVTSLQLAAFIAPNLHRRVSADRARCAGTRECAGTSRIRLCRHTPGRPSLRRRGYRHSELVCFSPCTQAWEILPPRPDRAWEDLFRSPLPCPPICERCEDIRPSSDSPSDPFSTHRSPAPFTAAPPIVEFDLLVCSFPCYKNTQSRDENGGRHHPSGDLFAEEQVKFISLGS